MFKKKIVVDASLNVRLGLSVCANVH